MKYAFFDGDNVGNTIEIFLIEGKIEEAKKLSKDIIKTHEKIKKELKGKAEILIMGGDDLLIKIDKSRELYGIVNNIRTIFRNGTGLTLSCGVGETIESAIYQLNLAKLYGKNRVKSENND